VSNIEFVWIPAGQFYMGSPENEAGRDSDEGPRHPVSIEHGFWLSAKEVTTAQYCSFLDVAGNGDAAGSPFVDMSEPDGPFRRSRGGFAVRDGWAGRPAPNVSWEGAVAFCSGMQGRLPSEAEWEYACRAGSDSPYTDNVSSPRDAGSYAWHWGNSDGKPSAVGLKRPNRWGLYDMHGNVWEWCSDWYAARYNAADRRNPAGPSSGTTHVMRGGSWLGEAEPCRSAARNDIETRSAAGLNCVGFRVALDSQWSRD
jgi:formylglycine-generating enzyme required for sulfatase activity